MIENLERGDEFQMDHGSREYQSQLALQGSLTIDVLLVHPLQAAEQIFLINTHFSGLVELVGEIIKHKLAVAVGVDVSARLCRGTLGGLRR
jgi:hypothetical protein